VEGEFGVAAGHRHCSTLRVIGDRGVATAAGMPTVAVRVCSHRELVRRKDDPASARKQQGA
jgi:hypothetical protein